MDDLSRAVVDRNEVTIKTLRKIDGSIRKNVERALLKFAKNPLHPSLNFEKITGLSNLYSIRASISIRIYMASYEGYSLTIVHVGNHDVPTGW